jgi:hypothetical protein
VGLPLFGHRSLAAIANHGETLRGEHGKLCSPFLLAANISLSFLHRIGNVAVWEWLRDI